MSRSDVPIPMPVDVVSDVVCPWCFVGKRRLEKAMALAPNISLNVRWRPYFLNPWVPREGISRTEYLTTKFGSVAGYESIAQRIAVAAEAVGLEIGRDGALDKANEQWPDESGRVVKKAARAFFKVVRDHPTGMNNAPIEMIFAHFLKGPRR